MSRTLLRGASLALTLLAAGPAAALDNQWLPPGDGGELVFEPADPAVVCQNSLDEEIDRLLMRGVNLGAPVGDLQWVSGWCFQSYQQGMIYSTAPLGGSFGVAVYGPILAEFAAQGLHNGPLGRPVIDQEATRDPGAVRQAFIGGWVDAHPVFGTNTVHVPIAGLWYTNGAESRLGYPLADPQSMLGNIGTFSQFENGFGARIPALGAWVDETGALDEGQVTPSITLRQDINQAGASRTLGLASQSPVAFSGQVGALNNLASSLALDNLPARASAFFFDGSNLTGRWLRVTGATSGVRVANIGAWMNDRISSVLVANHGTVSSRQTAEDLRVTVQNALDAMDTGALMDAALEGRDASGWLSWRGDAVVTLLPGQRAVRISRRAYMDIDASCVGIFNCNADGEVRFEVTVRPQVVGRYRMHVEFVSGTATSLSCSGEGCGDRAEALATLFQGDVIGFVQDEFDNALNTNEANLDLLSRVCDDEIAIKRIHVLPQFVEIVLGDTATAGACAARNAGAQVNVDRPAARAENSDGTLVATTVTNRFTSVIGGAVLAR